MVERPDGDHALLAVVVHLADIQHIVIIHFKLALHVDFHDRLADGA